MYLKFYNFNIWNIYSYLYYLILFKIYKKKINLYIDTLSKININIEINYNFNFFEIKASFFNINIKKILHKLFFSFLKMNFSINEFNDALIEIKQYFLVWLSEAPYLLAYNYLTCILSNLFFSYDQLLIHIDKLNFSDFEKYTKKTNNLYCIFFYHGDQNFWIYKDICLLINKSLNFQNKNILGNILKLKENKQFHFRTHNKDENDTIVCFISYYQCFIVNKKFNFNQNYYYNFILTNILLLLLKWKFFNDLRTKEQIGYIVQMKKIKMQQILGLIFVVQFDQKKFWYSFVQNKVSNFINNFLNWKSIDNIDIIKKTLLIKLWKKNIWFFEKTSHYYKKFYENDNLSFDEKKNIIENISENNIFHFAKQIFKYHLNIIINSWNPNKNDLNKNDEYFDDIFLVKKINASLSH